MSAPRLEGAACLDIAPQVRSKFFDSARSPIYRQAAKNICASCVVLGECRQEALNGPLQRNGVMAGMTGDEIKNARAWLSYEHGLRDAPPRGQRPAWLPLSEAAHLVVQLEYETDPDEEAVLR